MASAEQVQTAIRSLLPNVDLDGTTERQIRQKLADQLNSSVDAHVELIKTEIDAYLALLDGQPDAASAAVGEKRKAPEPATPVPVAEFAIAADANTLPLSDVKRVEVKLFKGRVQVDIRELWKDKSSGELKPGQKGVALSADAWQTLSIALPAIDAALQGADTSYSLQLSDKHRATVSEFKSEPLRVDIREYYEKHGELRPTKKGVSLQPPEWQQLLDGRRRVQQAVDAMQPQPAAASGAGPSQMAAAGDAESAAGGAAAPGGNAAAAGPADGQDFTLPLTSNRRVSVRVYNKRVLVDLRETYEKDGQQLPGRKGIALSPEQFAALKAASGDLSTALQAKDTSCVFDLGNTRKASVSIFKGTARVSVREFYQKEGQELPGSKGLDMPQDQWGALVAGLEQIQAEVARRAA